MKDIYEVWSKNGRQEIFRCSPDNEWRERYYKGTLFVGGWSYFHLITEGWVLWKRLKEI